MNDRVEQTYALLASFADWEPSIRVDVARGAIRGESPGDVKLCEVCEGTGTRGDTRFPCRVCKGRGTLAIDPQTGNVVRDEADAIETLVKRVRTVCSGCGGSGKRSASSRRDPGERDVLVLDERTGRYNWRRAERDTCPDCAGTGSRETIVMAKPPATAPELDPVGDPLGVIKALERKQRQWQRGSYPQLEVRLQLLEVRYPWARTMVDRHVIHPIGATLTLAARERLDWAVEWLEQGMPYPIVVPEEARRDREALKHSLWRGRTQAHRRQRKERNQRIISELLDGAEPSAVANRYGLSARRVQQIAFEISLVRSSFVPTIAA